MAAITRIGRMTTGLTITGLTTTTHTTRTARMTIIRPSSILQTFCRQLLKRCVL